MAKGRNRIWLLDELRGVAVLGMVVYHAAYDLYAIFGVELPLFSPPLTWLQTYVCCSFILISGVSCRLSHNNLRRGAITFGVGLLMTAGTLIFMPSEAIWFGILHFLGCAMMLYALVGRFTDKLNPLLGTAVFMALFLALVGIERGTVLFGTVAVPASFYRYAWLAPLGFPGGGFSSADYFPLLPWLLLFFCGSSFGWYFKERRLPAPMMKKHSAFLAGVGQNALAIYIVHQPVIYGLLWLVFTYIIK